MTEAKEITGRRWPAKSRMANPESRELMTGHDDDIIVGKAYDAALMRRLMGYLRPYWPSVLLAFTAIVSASVLQLAQPYLMKVAIDRYIATSDVAGMDRIALLFLAILLASFALEFVQTYVLQHTGQRIMFDLRAQIYRHFQRLDVAYYDRNPVGRLMTRVTTDVDALNDLFTSGVVSVFGDIFTLAGIMIVLLAMDWRLALVAFSVLPLIVLITQWFRRHVRDSYRTVRALIARINAFLQENITGMATVQLFGREARNLGQFREINGRHRDANIDSIFYYAVFYPAVEIVGALATALIIWWGGAWVLAGTLTLGSLVAFIQVLAAVLQADQRHVGEVQPAPVGHGRLRAHLHAARHAGGRRVARVADAGRVAGHVVFEHVWFAYDGEHTCSETCLSRCVPGERVGIVGATGAGKSTIINLLLAVLRRRPGPHPRRRRRHPRDRPRRTAAAVQPRAAGRARVLGHDWREHQAGEPGDRRPSRCGGRSRRCTPTGSSTRCRRARRRRWPSAGRRCRRGRSSCCRSPGRWPSTRASWCSTRRRRASTPKRNC